jgi:chromosomal replication initiator protein
MNEFRTEFRNQCDILLVDDIQTIAGKDATQKEFFHTFNALYNAGKQIVITSDQPPQELPGIEERLASRFAWGLCADIQPPEMETRIAILEQKAASDGIELDKEVAILLAKHIRSNVRELEGTLVRLSAQAKLTEQSITVDMAREMLDRMNLERDRELDVERIIRVVADHFDITPTDIKGSRRTRAISTPRQYAMYLSRKYTEHSYPELGCQFGGKDHTTVLAACQKYEDLVEEDEEVDAKVRELEGDLFG